MYNNIKNFFKEKGVYELLVFDDKNEVIKDLKGALTIITKPKYEAVDLIFKIGEYLTKGNVRWNGKEFTEHFIETISVPLEDLDKENFIFPNVRVLKCMGIDDISLSF